jgi:hypothetical protein
MTQPCLGGSRLGSAPQLKLLRKSESQLAVDVFEQFVYHPWHGNITVSNF